MRAWSLSQRRQGKEIAFVPTMGALHEGHLSLLREGKRRCDALALSIYVNPAQFAPTEDLDEYPRDLEGDLAKAKGCGVDAVFLPNDEAMYPGGYQTYIAVEGVTKNLCGASRPTHFRGVATIVVKLFNIVMPDAAIFGEKDFQQLVVIRRMVKDLNMPIEIIGHPIVREEDGVAMSSRNAYLSRKERAAARSINRSLIHAQKMIDSGTADVEGMLRAARDAIEATGILRTDYIKLVDADTLEDLKKFERPALLAIAAFAGKTRLIDNRLFS